MSGLEQTEVGEGTRLGLGTVLEPGVVLGRNCLVGNFVTIHSGSWIGDGVRIDDYGVVGKLPLCSVNSATTCNRTLPGAVVGNGTMLGTGAIIYRGASLGADVLVADAAVVREDSNIGQKTIVGRGATVENHCVVGARCKLQSLVYLCAHSRLDDDCFVGPGVVSSNDNYMARDPARLTQFCGLTMRRGARLGAGVVVLPGKVIGEEAAVGAGSLVTRDIPPGELWVGSPARYLRQVPQSQLLINNPPAN